MVISLENNHLVFTSLHLLQVLQRSLCTLNKEHLKIQTKKNKLQYGPKEK